MMIFVVDLLAVCHKGSRPGADDMPGRREPEVLQGQLRDLALLEGIWQAEPPKVLDRQCFRNNDRTQTSGLSGYRRVCQEMLLQYLIATGMRSTLRRASPDVAFG